MIQQVQATNQSPNEVGFGFDAQQCIEICIGVRCKSMIIYNI